MRDVDHPFSPCRRAGRPALAVGLLAAACLFAAGQHAAAQPADPALGERVRQLERELAEVREAMAAERAEAVAQEPQPETNVLGVRLPVDITLYGYLKGDMSWDDSHVYPGNFALWVLSEVEEGHHANPVSGAAWDEGDDELNATANQSRIGLSLSGPRAFGAAVTGKVEVDFYGGGAAENKPRPLMRHAYVEVGWPWLRLLAGQTWDVIAPANAPTLNYPVLWSAGNIGYRRPQLRLSSDLGIADVATLSLQVAAARSIHDVCGIEDNVNPEDGEDAGWPTLQSRVALSFSAGPLKKAAFAAWGHYGAIEVDVTGGERDLETWSLGADMTLDFGLLALTCEVFHGRNLGTYFGGIAQSVAVSDRFARGKEIPSCGGFAALSLKPLPWLTLSAGHGVDDPYDSYLADGMRSRNSCTFGNIKLKLLEVVTAGVEVSWWETTYENAPRGDALRVQSSVMLSF